MPPPGLAADADAGDEGGPTVQASGKELQLFDLRRLRRYLAGVVPGFPAAGGDLRVRRFSTGRSNPTFLVAAEDGEGARRVVVRKKPVYAHGHRHQIEKEFRVLEALSKAGLPVPHPYALCADESILGTPFTVVEYLPGRALSAADFSQLCLQEQRAVLEQAAAVLARLHSLDWRRLNLGWLRKHRDGQSFYERQLLAVERMSGDAVAARGQGSAVPEIQGFAGIVRALRRAQPEVGDAALRVVHGDFGLHNLLFARERPAAAAAAGDSAPPRGRLRLVAVLDWELCTLGCPHFDNGSCITWSVHDRAAREVYIEAYARASGAPADGPGLSYAHAFHSLFFAAKVQGILMRLAASAGGGGARGAESAASRQEWAYFVRLLEELAAEAHRLVGKLTPVPRL